MTLDCLMAFTVSDDHRQQEKVWKALPDYARHRPDDIRDALTEKHVATDSKLAQFVGIDAYAKAGGAVLRDLFEDGNAWLTDPALLNQLAAAKLEDAAGAVRREGWKWVEIIADLTWEALKPFGHGEPARLAPTAEQQKEIDALTAEADAIIDQHGEDPEDDVARDRYDEIGQRLDELSEGEEMWADDTKANAGAVIGIAHNGDLDIRRGLIRPEDKAAAKKAPNEKNGANGTGKKEDAESSGLSAALVENFTAHRTAALQAMLSGNPKVALVAIVHALALDCLCTTSFASRVKVSGSTTPLAQSAEGIEDSAACKQFAATVKAVTKGMPKQPERLWSWLADRDQKTLLAILAVCAASTVDAVERRRGAMDHAPDAAHAGQLAEALKLDMTKYWHPTKSYFGRVPKGLILDAVREGIGKPAADNIATLKKDAMADRATKLLAGKDWLPAILR